MRLALAMLLVACASPHPDATVSNEYRGPRDRVTVRGVVLDYANRPAAGAEVSSGLDRVKTDEQGRFSVEAVPKNFVSAAWHDGIGHIRVGNDAVQVVEIHLQQMPM